MIDRAQRDQLSQDLRRLVTGQMTNDEFDDVYFEQYEPSQDEAVREIASFGYGLYSSDVLFPYRLKGWHRVANDTRQMASRSVLFLRRNLEYEWPSPPNDSAWGCLWTVSFNLGFPGAIAMLFICAALWGSGDVGFALRFGIPSALVFFFTSWILFFADSTESREWQAWKSTGDWEVWPFFRQADFVNARSNR